MRFESKRTEEINETGFCQLFMWLAMIMACITMAASIFLIRHKISNDIEDQMQQIGVLEALGYRSKEISLAYLYEYILSGGFGAMGFGLGAAGYLPAEGRRCQ